MAEVVLFHHALGRTPGVVAFGDLLRARGHAVHVPDLFDGHTFDSLKAGVAHVEATGMDQVIERGVEAVDRLPAALVYAGFSLGVLPAQKLAQTRPGALGALLVSACIPPTVFGSWPHGVPLQIHGMAADPVFADEGDLEAAREITSSVEQAELFLYPGSGHLFIEEELPAYDPAAGDLLTRRALAFLAARP